MVFFLESFDEAGEVSMEVAAKMAEHGIPANPMNCTVWYNYCGAGDPELVREIDHILADNGEFTPKRNEEIFAKFFVGADNENWILRSSAELERQVDDISQNVKEASSNSINYGRKLAGYSADLPRGMKNKIGAIVRRMLKETREMVAKNHQMEQRLRNSGKQIYMLRQTIKGIERETMTDPLTEIANRRCFDKKLLEETVRTSPGGSGVCLILCDIDHFKIFNDRYGHPVGDAVLKIVARCLDDSAKESGLAARYGGEEFAVILPDTKMDEAKSVAHKIRERLAKSELKNSKSGQRYGRITLSFGLAQYRVGETLADFVDRCDAALYHAKETGRDRVVSEQEPEDQVDGVGSLG